MPEGHDTPFTQHGPPGPHPTSSWPQWPSCRLLPVSQTSAQGQMSTYLLFCGLCLCLPGVLPCLLLHSQAGFEGLDLHIAIHFAGWHCGSMMEATSPAHCLFIQTLLANTGGAWT